MWCTDTWLCLAGTKTWQLSWEWGPAPKPEGSRRSALNAGQHLCDMLAGVRMEHQGSPRPPFCTCVQEERHSSRQAHQAAAQ